MTNEKLNLGNNLNTSIDCTEEKLSRLSKINLKLTLDCEHSYHAFDVPDKEKNIGIRASGLEGNVNKARFLKFLVSEIEITREGKMKLEEEFNNL